MKYICVPYDRCQIERADVAEELDVLLRHQQLQFRDHDHGALQGA